MKMITVSEILRQTPQLGRAAPDNWWGARPHPPRGPNLFAARHATFWNEPSRERGRLVRGFARRATRPFARSTPVSLSTVVHRNQSAVFHLRFNPGRI
jgi:hypothetical protein